MKITTATIHVPDGAGDCTFGPFVVTDEQMESILHVVNGIRAGAVTLNGDGGSVWVFPATLLARSAVSICEEEDD